MPMKSELVEACVSDGWTAARERAAEALHDVNTQLSVMLRRTQGAADAAGTRRTKPKLALPLLLLLEFAESVDALGVEYEALSTQHPGCEEGCGAVLKALAQFRDAIPLDRTPI